MVPALQWWQHFFTIFIFYKPNNQTINGENEQQYSIIKYINQPILFQLNWPEFTSIKSTNHVVTAKLEICLHSPPVIRIQCRGRAHLSPPAHIWIFSQSPSYSHHHQHQAGFLSCSRLHPPSDVTMRADRLTFLTRCTCCYKHSVIKDNISPDWSVGWRMKSISLWADL